MVGAALEAARGALHMMKDGYNTLSPIHFTMEMDHARN